MTCGTARNEAKIQSEVPRKYVLHDREIQANCINYLKSYSGKKIEVNVTYHVADQTDSQRGYFHWACGIFGKAVGYTGEEIKRLVKKELWGTEIIIIAGREMEIYKSMAKFKTNKLDYADAIDALLRIAAEAEVFIPDPVKEFK